MKLGLSLSGGGIKGVAHIGALKAFEENNIKFDVVTGTSSGSIIATLYAAGYSSDEMLKIFNKFSKKIKYVDFRNVLKLIFGLFYGEIAIKGFNSGRVIEKAVNDFCKQKNISNISDFKLPLGIPSVDLYTNTISAFISTNYLAHKSKNINYINDIQIGKAVKASTAFPGIFEPVKFKDNILVDGGLKENTPWKLAKDLGADKVINIIFDTPYKMCKCDNIVQIIESSINVLSREASLCDMIGAECVIHIHTDEGIGLLDMKYTNQLYELGYAATIKKINEIRKMGY